MVWLPRWGCDGMITSAQKMMMARAGVPKAELKFLMPFVTEVGSQEYINLVDTSGAVLASVPATLSTSTAWQRYGDTLYFFSGNTSTSVQKIDLKNPSAGASSAGFSLGRNLAEGWFARVSQSKLLQVYDAGNVCYFYDLEAETATTVSGTLAGSRQYSNKNHTTMSFYRKTAPSTFADMSTNVVWTSAQSGSSSSWMNIGVVDPDNDTLSHTASYTQNHNQSRNWSVHVDESYAGVFRFENNFYTPPENMTSSPANYGSTATYNSLSYSLTFSFGGDSPFGGSSHPMVYRVGVNGTSRVLFGIDPSATTPTWVGIRELSSLNNVSVGVHQINEAGYVMVMWQENTAGLPIKMAIFDGTTQVGSDVVVDVSSSYSTDFTNQGYQVALSSELEYVYPSTLTA